MHVGALLLKSIGDTCMRVGRMRVSEGASEGASVRASVRVGSE